MITSKTETVVMVLFFLLGTIIYCFCLFIFVVINIESQALSWLATGQQKQ